MATLTFTNRAKLKNATTNETLFIAIVTDSSNNDFWAVSTSKEEALNSAIAEIGNNIDDVELRNEAIVGEFDLDSFIEDEEDFYPMNEYVC